MVYARDACQCLPQACRYWCNNEFLYQGERIVELYGIADCDKSVDCVVDMLQMDCI